MIRWDGLGRAPANVGWCVLVAFLAGCGAALSACGSADGDRTKAQGSRAAARVRPDVPVTSVDVQTAVGHNSPAVAVDPTDARFAVVADRIDAPTPSCDLQMSGDGGRTWISADPVPTLPRGAERCYAPEVAFSRGGRLFYLFVGLHTQANAPMGVFLTSSTDRGRHFSKPRQVVGGHPFGVTMAIDRSFGDHGRIHLAWIEARADPIGVGFPSPPNPVVASHSDDGGRSFSSPVAVSDARRLLVTAPTIVVGRDHAVHVAYYDLGEDQTDYRGLDGPTFQGVWSLVVASSFDAGGHYSAATVVEPRVVPPGRVLLVLNMPPPSLASGPGGRLYLAWHDARNGDWDVFLRRSADQGRSWGPRTRVNDDRLRDRRTQYLPKVSVAPDGRVDVIYFDRRDDPANVFNDVSYTSSFDQGRSFSPARRLNGQRFDSRFGAHYLIPYFAPGMVEFGGRLGLVSADKRTLAAWTDTRMSFGTLTPRENFGPAAQGIYAAEIDFTQAHTDHSKVHNAAISRPVADAGNGSKRNRGA